jgi:hypothetical protein
MPQAPEALRQRWGHYDAVNSGDLVVSQFLESHGYKLLRNFEWLVPEGHQPTEDELSAIDYMAYEWDYGGWTRTEEPRTGASVWMEAAPVFANALAKYGHDYSKQSHLDVCPMCSEIDAEMEKVR